MSLTPNFNTTFQFHHVQTFATFELGNMGEPLEFGTRDNGEVEEEDQMRNEGRDE